MARVQHMVWSEVHTCITCDELAMWNDDDDRTRCGITFTTSEIIVCCAQHLWYYETDPHNMLPITKCCQQHTDNCDLFIALSNGRCAVVKFSKSDSEKKIQTEVWLFSQIHCFPKKTDWDKLREASKPKPARSLQTFQFNTGNDMEASSKEFRVASPWELLYIDYLVVIVQTKYDLIKRLN